MTITKHTLTITHLNSSGEGVAFSEEGQTILVPFTLASEKVTVALDADSQKSNVRRATLEKILEPSPDRQKPLCPYFTQCGGCQLQHLNAVSYTKYKQRLVANIFKANKLDAAVLEPVVFGPGLRRRINFKITRKGSRVLVGFHRRRSHEVLDIEECPLLLTDFNALLNPLKTALGSCMHEREEANIFLTKVDEGFDATLVFEDPKKLSLGQIESLTQWAHTHQVVRLLLKTPKSEELLVHRTSPHVSFAGAPVLFPSHAFLQTSGVAEDHMTSLVLSLIPHGALKIADLFSGLGTFSFPLAQKGKVKAFEGDFKAVQYCNLSAQQNQLSHALEATQRDLFKYPLSTVELNSYDVVVLDPPRAGAVSQIKQLMESSVKTVIMVSCNANTFARDAHLLVKGGYHMGDTHLIDQFLWSPHVELISSFVRP